MKLSAVHVHSRVVAHVYKNRFFESSGKNRTWRNLTEDNGRRENPENAVFSRLFAPLCIEYAVKIRVRKSPPISPGSNGFSEKPIRILDRTEHFFAPKSRFWQCVKSTGYAGLHPKSYRQMQGRNQNCCYCMLGFCNRFKLFQVYATGRFWSFSIFQRGISQNAPSALKQYGVHLNKSDNGFCIFTDNAI